MNEFKESSETEDYWKVLKGVFLWTIDNLMGKRPRRRETWQWKRGNGLMILIIVLVKSVNFGKRDKNTAGQM